MYIGHTFAPQYLYAGDMIGHRNSCVSKGAGIFLRSLLFYIEEKAF